MIFKRLLSSNTQTQDKEFGKHLYMNIRLLAFVTASNEINGKCSPAESNFNTNLNLSRYIEYNRCD